MTKVVSKLEFDTAHKAFNEAKMAFTTPTPETEVREIGVLQCAMGFV